MTPNAELACVYSALVLADDDVAITGEKIQTTFKIANVDVEPYWAGLFAKALEGVNFKELITKIGSGVGAALAVAVPYAGAPAAAAPAAVKEGKKKESEPEESDDDVGLGFFD